MGVPDRPGLAYSVHVSPAGVFGIPFTSPIW